VTRGAGQRLGDIVLACDEIAGYLTEGPAEDPLSVGIVFAAVTSRLIIIGAAIRGLDAQLLRQAPEVPWRQVSDMRNHLAHRYFDTHHAIVLSTVVDDIPVLRAAALRLLALVDES